MKKPVKISLIVVVIVLLIFLIPVGIFLGLDLNNYKQTIADAVQKTTGRTLTIKGELSKSVFPWLGVEVGQITLSNASGFKPAAFAHADKIQIKVALLPLFKKQVHVAAVVLKGLAVNLAVNKEGVSNWADLTKATAEPPAPTATPAKPTKPTTPASTPAMSSLGALVIGGIDIRDAQLRWDDQQAGALYQVNHLNLRSGEIRIDKTIPVTLSLDASSNQMKAKAHMQWSGDVTLNPATQRYRVKAMKLAVKANGDAVPGDQVEATLNADVDADFKNETASLNSLTLKTLGVKLSGKVSLDHLLKSPTYKGHLDIATFNPRDVMQDLAIKAPVTTDTKVLSKASAGFAIQGSLDDVAMNDLKLVLDDSTLSGKIALNHFSQPSISYTLNLDNFNADRYMPPPSKATPAAPAPTSAGAAVVASASLPSPLLRTLDASGTLDIGHLTTAQLDINDVSSMLYAKGGQIRLHPLTAKLYDGSYNGDIKLDARGDTPIINVNEHIKDVKVEPALKAVANIDKLSGTMTLNAKLTMNDVTMPGLVNTLNGNANFQFNDGEIKGMDLKQKLTEEIAKLQHKTLPSNTDQGKTYFAEMSGTISVVNGVAHNDDFVMNSHTLQATGQGDVDLPKQNIDYHLQAVLLKSGLDSNNKILEALADEKIPFKITGPLNDPKFGVDEDALRKMVKAAAHKAVEKQLDKQKAKEKAKVKKKIEEKKEELRDKFKDRLKGLFNR